MDASSYHRKVLQKAYLPLAALGPSGIGGEYSYPIWPENIGAARIAEPPLNLPSSPRSPSPPVSPALPDPPIQPPSRGGRLTGVLDTVEENAPGLPPSYLALAMLAFVLGFATCALCLLLLKGRI